MKQIGLESNKCQNAHGRGVKLLDGGPFLLAMDFGGTKSAIAITDGQGTILRRTTIAVVDCIDAKDVLSKALQCGVSYVEEILQEDPGRLLTGIGLSTMGITLPDRVLMAPNIPGWGDLRIADEVGRYFPEIPVRIDNDMKASALAELRRGKLRGTQSGLYVNVGTGFGTALTYGSHVVSGAHGAAGEMAYNLLSSKEPKGYRQGVTPLENVLGGRGIGERASLLYGRALTSRDVFEMAATDLKARDLVESITQEMAFHITNFVISWDPEKVVFGGGMVASKDWILPMVEKYFADFVPFPPIIEIAHFKHDAGLFGAIELAMDAAEDRVRA